MADLLDRAKAADCSALVFTVDMPVPGSRYRDHRSGLAGGGAGPRGATRRLWQALKRPRWAWDVGVRGRPRHLGWMRDNFDATVSWRDLDFVRQRWDGPLIVKGILDPADARIAADEGADGLIVSNHGGRHLAGVPSTARACRRSRRRSVTG